MYVCMSIARHASDMHMYLCVYVNYMIAIGVSYILLDRQLVLSYVYISNPVKINKGQMLRSTPLIIIKY